MSDYQDMGQDLTEQDMDPFGIEDPTALGMAPLRIQKRSVSVK